MAARFGAPATVMFNGVVCLAASLVFTRKLPGIRKIVRPIYVRMGIVPETVRLPKRSNLFDSISRGFRARRMHRFIDDFGITPQTRVLDIGGTLYNWTLTPVRPRLTLLNMPRASEPAPEGVDRVAADGCVLPFADGCVRRCVQQLRDRTSDHKERQQQFAEKWRGWESAFACRRLIDGSRWRLTC